MITFDLNATDRTIDLFIADSSSTVGAGLTALVFNSAGLTCYYRKGATGSATVLSLVTQTVGGAHTDGGFVEVDATNMPGVYRLDLPDTLFDTKGYSTVFLKGATNMAPVAVRLHVSVLEPGIIMGKAQTGTLSTTQATTDLTGYADDELIGRVVTFVSGTAEGQSARITDYASASGLLTYTTLATAPVNGDQFKIT